MNNDVIIVGGGHNGLVAAAYLARAGLKVTVCEARDVVGGAAVSEHPFGPDYTVTSLSYVVSLLPPSLVKDLRLERLGYHVYPQGPYFAPRADGGYLQLPDDPVRPPEQIGKFSNKDAAAYDRWESWMARARPAARPAARRDPAQARLAQTFRPARTAGAAARTSVGSTSARRSTSPGY